MLRKLLKISGYIFTSVVGGLVMITIYNEFNKNKDKDEDVKAEKELPYDNYYHLGLSQEEVSKKETEENIGRGVVEEETPEGKIIMTFDDDNENYVYYGPKSVSYKYLETVARKYVIIFDCKDKYINIFHELYTAWEKVEKQKEQDNNKVEDNKTTGIFASLKSYNNGTKGDIGTEKSKRADSQKKYAVVNEKANRYSCKGSYNDYLESLKEVKPVARDISWETFKQNK